VSNLVSSSSSAVRVQTVINEGRAVMASETSEEVCSFRVCAVVGVETRQEQNLLEFQLNDFWISFGQDLDK